MPVPLQSLQEVAGGFLGWAGPFLGVVLIDLVLAGDNAVVIALAARGLSPKARRRAIVWGAGAAVGLRLAFAAIITLLLKIPLLRAAGGVLLLWIAWKLLVEKHDAEVVEEGTTVWQAVRIIVVADIIMSLDNVVALVGVAHENLVLIAAGLLLTVPLLIWGSSWISAMMTRMPLLTYIGAVILVWTAGGMVFEDGVVHNALPHAVLAAETPIKLVVALLFCAAAWRYNQVRVPDRTA
ncbi:MAG: TerC family protein [Clostridia bacterium]|nr:TerC family protein [Clostridia bacterium]